MRARFVEQYGLSSYDAGVLTAHGDLAAYYERVAAEVDPKPVSGRQELLENEVNRVVWAT